MPDRPDPAGCIFCRHPAHLAGECAAAYPEHTHDYVEDTKGILRCTICAAPLGVVTSCPCQVSMSQREQDRRVMATPLEGQQRGMEYLERVTAPTVLTPEDEEKISALLGVVSPPEPADVVALLRPMLAMLDGFMASMQAVADGVSAILAVLEPPAEAEAESDEPDQ